MNEKTKRNHFQVKEMNMFLCAARSARTHTQRHKIENSLGSHSLMHSWKKLSIAAATAAVTTEASRANTVAYQVVKSNHNNKYICVSVYTEIEGKRDEAEAEEVKTVINKRVN